MNHPSLNLMTLQFNVGSTFSTIIIGCIMFLQYNSGLFKQIAAETETQSNMPSSMIEKVAAMEL